MQTHDPEKGEADLLVEQQRVRNRVYILNTLHIFLSLGGLKSQTEMKNN